MKFEEEPNLSEYIRFSMANPEKKLQQYLKRNKISKNEFSNISGISRKAMTDWFNGNKSISENSYRKIKNAIIKIENDKNKDFEIE